MNNYQKKVEIVTRLDNLIENYNDNLLVPTYNLT